MKNGISTDNFYSIGIWSFFFIMTKKGIIIGQLRIKILLLCKHFINKLDI